jgi:hypothetical protein
MLRPHTCPDAHPRRRLTRLPFAIVPIALLAFVLFQTACTTIVSPPRPDSLLDPVAVYLIDYHRHSALMLPMDDGRYREYAYGEWGWFALNRTALIRAPGILFFTSAGALGRADHPAPADADALRLSGGFQAVFELRVERARAAALLRRLDERFDARLDTLVHNQAVGLDLVRDPDRYSIAWHCNHATVAWLRELGVEAWPVTAVARFRVRPAPSPRRQAPGRARAHAGGGVPA